MNGRFGLSSTCVEKFSRTFIECESHMFHCRKKNERVTHFVQKMASAAGALGF
jgi:hypothetical protein